MSSDENSPVVTFQRRRKGQQQQQLAKAPASNTGNTAVFITSDSSTRRDAAADSSKNKTGAASQSPLPGAWRKTRKTRQPSQQEQARYASHVSHLKEKFAEIDAFELIAETPSPQGYQSRDDCDGRGHAGRPMLSCERYDKRDRSVAKGERSGSMLERVSHGLQDALGWLNKSVLKSGGAGKKNRLASESLDRVGMALDFGGAIDRLDTKEEIFTIGEGSDEGEEEKETTSSVRTEAVQDVLEEAINKLRIHETSAVADTADIGASPPSSSSLRQLLHLCKQDDNLSKIPSMDALLKRLLSSSSSSTTTSKRATFDAKKVGEGTFGEAFKTRITSNRQEKEVVFKIVPIETLPTQKTAAEILSEAEVSLKLTQLREAVDPSKKSITSITNITGGFVETHAIGVCRGAYSQQLVAEWNRWNGLHRSENDPVDAYGASQLYAVFVQANGGIDLETFKPRNFDEVKSILLQVALTLAVAENACQFEHRDLHWGNVLVRRSGAGEREGRLECTMNDVDICVDTSGVNVTLIDFTLSRLNPTTSNEPSVVYCNLSNDPEIFNGPEGDLQADAYRRMLAEVDSGSIMKSSDSPSPWSSYHPRTNAIWIEYLAGIMLHYKGKWKKTEREALACFMDRAREEGDSAESLVWDSFFAGCWE